MSSVINAQKWTKFMDDCSSPGAVLFVIQCYPVIIVVLFVRITRTPTSTEPISAFLDEFLDGFSLSLENKERMTLAVRNVIVVHLAIRVDSSDLYIPSRILLSALLLTREMLYMSIERYQNVLQVHLLILLIAFS